jgi:hypothetical protein
MRAFTTIAAATLLFAPVARAEEPARDDKAAGEFERARAEAQAAVEKARQEEARAAAEEARKAAREFAKRFKTSVENVPGDSRGRERNMARLTMDDVLLLRVPAIRIETGIEGKGENRALVVRKNDWTETSWVEISRVPIRRFDVKPWALPPLAFPNIDVLSTKAVSQTINGVSTTKVWINGWLVYEGPGGSSQISTTKVHIDDSMTSVEVKVDGRVVYKACQGEGVRGDRSDSKRD